MTDPIGRLGRVVVEWFSGDSGRRAAILFVAGVYTVGVVGWFLPIVAIIMQASAGGVVVGLATLAILAVATYYGVRLGREAW